MIGKVRHLVKMVTLLSSRAEISELLCPIYVPSVKLRRQLNMMGGSGVQIVASLQFLLHCVILPLLTLSKSKNPRSRLY